jgi:hypothetical protein
MLNMGPISKRNIGGVMVVWAISLMLSYLVSCMHNTMTLYATQYAIMYAYGHGHSRHGMDARSTLYADRRSAGRVYQWQGLVIPNPGVLQAGHEDIDLALYHACVSGRTGSTQYNHDTLML